MAERILIAEDESRVAQTLCRALSLPEGGNYHVESCGSGEEALALLRETRFDLLITDLRMPGMNGFELLHKCQSIRPDLRRILITAYGSPYIEEKADQLGVDAYLAKPFSIKSLVQAVQNTLNDKKRCDARRQNPGLDAEVHQALQSRMDRLCDDIGARAVLLHDHTGDALVESGQGGEFDRKAFLVAQGHTMAAASALSQVLGEQDAFDLHLHEGTKYETYTARANAQLFLTVILDKEGNNSRIGIVWLYLRRAITDLGGLLSNEPPPAAVQPMDAAEHRAALQALEEALQSADAASEPAPPRGVSADDHKAVISYEQAKALGLLREDDT